MSEGKKEEETIKFMEIYIKYNKFFIGKRKPSWYNFKSEFKNKVAIFQNAAQSSWE